MSRALVALLVVSGGVLVPSGAFAQDIVTKTRGKLSEPAGAPIARFALGTGIHVAPKADEGAHLAFETTLGANIALEGWGGAGPIFSLEGGYAYDGIGLHAAQLAPGVGYGHPMLYVTYHPRLLVGSAGDGFAIGMRNGLTGHLVADLLSLEVGHQYVHDDRANQQSVRVMFGINPAAAIYAISRLW